MPRWLKEAAKRLAGDYAKYSQRVGRPCRPRPEKIFIFARAALLSVEHEVDPQLYLYGMFHLSGWRTLIGYKAIVSEASVLRIKELESMVLEAYSSATLTVADPVDPDVELTAYREALKRSTIIHDGYDGCFSTIVDTGGYHPASPLCGACPVAKECAENAKLVYGTKFEKRAHG
jgi:hypothetical protein